MNSAVSKHRLYPAQDLEFTGRQTWFVAGETTMKAKRISIVTYEVDRWQGDLLQRKLVSILEANGVPTASVIPAVAGYTKTMGITTRSLVDAGGRLPLLVEFVAQEEQANRVLPIIKAMLGARTISTSEVEIEAGLTQE
jgi:PII-like signaling protein